ncbi:MAG: metallophosphoesterase [Desulfocurvibacter africanus]
MKGLYWIVFGDMHGQTGNVARIPGIREAEGIIISGDLTNHGGPNEVMAVVEAVRRVNSRVLAQIGNMDKPAADKALFDAGLNLHRAGLELAPGLGIMGVGYSTPTPFNTPSEAKEDVIAEWLRETHKLINDCERLVLVSHTPPHGTTTDVIGTGAHVGSTSVRQFIERVQPELCITGHIHESRAEDVIGRTRILNPGALAEGGYVRLIWDGGDVSATLESM